MSPNNCTPPQVYKILAYVSCLIPKQQCKMSTITHSFLCELLKNTVYNTIRYYYFSLPILYHQFNINIP